jgi:hypothetical protein
VFYENKYMVHRFLKNTCVSHVLFTSFFLKKKEFGCLVCEGNEKK